MKAWNKPEIWELNVRETECYEIKKSCDTTTSKPPCNTSWNWGWNWGWVYYWFRPRRRR